MMDYGKYKYEQQKKAAEARKKQKVIEIKEIKMRPTIDDHDYDVKMRSMRRFFEEGDKVKVTLRFRGREMAHQHLGMELLTPDSEGNRRLREDRAISEARRPPDDDGSGAALIQLNIVPGEHCEAMRGKGAIRRAPGSRVARPRINWHGEKIRMRRRRGADGFPADSAFGASGASGRLWPVSPIPGCSAPVLSGRCCRRTAR